MTKALIVCLLVFGLVIPVQAVSYTIPEAPDVIEEYMEDDSESFTEGLWKIILHGIATIRPGVAEAAVTCVSAIGICLLISLFGDFFDNSTRMVELVGVVCIAIILIQPARSMIQLGIQTVKEISQYGKLLLPVMTGALAAQGAVTKSGALYMATTFFDSLLSSIIANFLTPLLRMYLCFGTINRIFQQEILDSVCDFVKWLMTWSLKVILYVFTGYISITGVVGGTTDAAMLKATKLTISGMVPVVGGILSDASEAVLVSAETMKNAAGIYGLLVILGLWIEPFIKIGTQYLMLKITAGVCMMFGTKKMGQLVKDFSAAMGITLGMIGAVCMIQLISTMCYMKGVT